MGTGAYTFGDSTLAATRLALLADVFRETTTGFVTDLRICPRGFVVDLGCGPGFTTALLRDVCDAGRVAGVDSSTAFVSEASRRLGPGVEVLCADVRDLPSAIRGADLIFARFLLTHLREPAAAIEHWLGRIAPDGVLAVEEVESIATDEPTLGRYLDLQRRMLDANGQQLEIGPVIEAAARPHRAVVHSNVVAVTPPTAAAARMFAMNFATWRTRPAVTELATATELDEIETGLNALSESHASITWQLRQISIGAT